MNETLKAIIQSDKPTEETVKIETFRQIVREKQYQELDGVAIDMQTANLVCNVYDRLSEKNREKLMELPFHVIGKICWRLI